MFRSTRRSHHEGSESDPATGARGVSRRALLFGGFRRSNAAHTAACDQDAIGDLIVTVPQLSSSESGQGAESTGPDQPPGFRHFSDHTVDTDHGHGDGDAIATFVARLSPVSCLAYRGLVCTVCSEHCPESGAIIVEHGRPRINDDACTGCGDCVSACPAPSRAIQAVERRVG